MKRRIRLTEGNLRRLVESVINEGFYTKYFQTLALHGKIFEDDFDPTIIKWSMEDSYYDTPTFEGRMPSSIGYPFYITYDLSDEVVGVNKISIYNEKDGESAPITADISKSLLNKVYRIAEKEYNNYLHNVSENRHAKLVNQITESVIRRLKRY